MKRLTFKIFLVTLLFSTSVKAQQLFELPKDVNTRWIRFENFTAQKGRSFNCYVPMPFKKHAKIVFVNESDADELFFYDINLTKLKTLSQNSSYFHAYWSNNDAAKLREDFEILPRVNVRGRLLGTNLGVMPNTVYGDTWFGKGEVKIYLENDKQSLTLVGTGTEDYIGSAWNMGTCSSLYQGVTVVDKPARQYAFYRYHIPDPIYFQQNYRVTLQQMGGAGRDLIRSILKAGGRAKPVSVMMKSGLIKLLEVKDFPDLFDDKFPSDEWVNFYRGEDYSAAAYFYLDKPETNLPPLVPLQKRLKGIK